MPPASVTAPRRQSAKNRSTASLWRLRGYLRPYRGMLVTMGLASVAGVVVALMIPLVIRALVDGPIAERDSRGVLWYALLALALGLLEALLIFIRRRVQGPVVLGMETRLRGDLYRQLNALDADFHTHWQSGQLLSRVTTDLSIIRRFSGFGIVFLITNIIQLLLTVALLIRLYWPLGLVVAVAAVPIIYTSMTFEKRYTRISRRVQDQRGDIATQVEEAALGIRIIKSFGRRQHAFENYDRYARRLYDSEMDQVRLAARFWTFLEALPNVALVIVLLLGALAVGHGVLTLGTLVAFVTLMLSLIWPVESLGLILAMAQESMTAADRVLEILDARPQIVSGTSQLEAPSGHVRIENVEFAFPDSDEPVLHDLNLDIAPGTTMAIVGTTGSGKTTLTRLISRLRDATAGRIAIDERDITGLRLADVRTTVSNAFDEPTLFSMSARENLTLGRGDATESEIQEALDLTQANFLHDLPWGLDTRIGEQGMSLSGGQRQRLALARAIIARPDVLVLDDTLSALDVHTEAQVEEALRTVLAGTTAVIVAHRASTVQLADQVALIQDGTITHVGTHSELLHSVSAYRELMSADDSAGDDSADDDSQALETVRR